MANESKKFALLCCCLMTMQALRLVISTAGFCVVRFHIDCELFNIFISRLVNAVLMSQLFGNWLGDLIVFAASGQLKIYSLTLANWIELVCFCSALGSFCAGEEGMLNGFYWSIVIAYFWWKVGEAPAISIAALEVDWYFAGFTLSGVWAACLKGLVMTFVTNDKGIYSDALGQVNVTVVGDVSVVGSRSVKTTVDYRAARALFAITIFLATLMCLMWDMIQVSVNGQGRSGIMSALQAASERKGTNTTVNDTDNKLVDAIQTLTASETVNTPTGNATLNLNTSKVEPTTGVNTGDKQITVKGSGGTGSATNTINSNGPQTKELAEKVKGKLGSLVEGAWKITGVTLSGSQEDSTKFTLTVKVDSVEGSGGIPGDNTVSKALAVAAGVLMGAILAVPGALAFVWLGLLFKFGNRGQKVWGLAGAAGGFLMGGFGLGFVSFTRATEGETWVPSFKWGQGDWGENKAAVRVAALMGLGTGLVLGLVVGLIIGALKGSKKRGTAAGAFIGSFFGLWFGEIANGKENWKDTTGFVKGAAKDYPSAVVGCGFFIVVGGLGTVYSIYPGMAPCSITQFKYFNIIDILILALSSIGPLVIMGVDLAEAEWRLGKVITEKNDTTETGLLWGAIGMSVLMNIGTLICECIVLNVMQHPFSKTAQQVTTSGWRACTLTILMVSFQLTSTGIGFGCVAAGSGFNDGVYNALSTAVLWTMECCGVLGEGYLTELKKYEPGKWPTQGMGKWDAYWWWNGKAFGNAWAIWCCIGTTDLRRDIMLCRQ